ncbi:transglutaminase-like domain-containing protein [Streptomyces sp. NBC_01476]|uniref:transglutaminase-like domain-containing protein n=1 Tax=Streptomyces sp. NBC_01476 TaxID=2903881 RepID=UPI002E3582E7|nr:transglutaminase-like domain-containing protein [Streptomyces sp. NBC_01476]
MTMTPEIAAFHTAQSVASDPGEMAGLYDGLPTDVRELARVVRGLTVHRVEERLLDITHPVDRLHDDAETRYVDDILRLIVARDDAPLVRRRAYADQFVGICRDFALLHVSMLRHAGIPARMRCGFADYWGMDGFHFDHVVTEYWDDTRGWLLADAQLGTAEFADRFPGVDFDPMDVPRDRFLVAGSAWQAIRAGTADPETFGLPFEDGSMVGEFFVMGSVRLDLSALNKVETLQWDIWGGGPGPGEEPTEQDRELFDRVALVTGGDQVAHEQARRLFAEHDALRTPPTVLSLTPFNGPREVTLR